MSHARREFARARARFRDYFNHQNVLRHTCNACPYVAIRLRFYLFPRVLSSSGTFKGSKNLREEKIRAHLARLKLENSRRS